MRPKSNKITHERLLNPKQHSSIMGRIKPKLIKRTSRQLMENSSSAFDKTFERNKTILKDTVSSKKVRNKIAGYIARIKKNEKTIINNAD
jgi:small subunit ribosomal protein S17e